MEISFSWFKSRKKKEMEDLLNEQALLNIKLQNKVLQDELKKMGKPYRSLKLINDVITVVMTDGSILSKSGCTQDDYYKLRSCSTEAEVINSIKNKVTDPEEKPPINKPVDPNVVRSGFAIIKEHDDFEVKENAVYFKGINRSIPQMLIEKIAQVLTTSGDLSTEYIALKRFFMWTCLNPRAEVADQLYSFLMKNGMRITKQGFFVALRNVVNVAGDESEVVEFISNAYNKIKGVWKKKPSEFIVLNENGEYKFQKVKVRKDDSDLNVDEPYEGTVLGNLQDLYDNLPNMRENRFTDNWTKKFDIRIGKPVSMPPEDCSWSTKDCAEAGLHFAGHTAPYVLCGDTSVFVLINPMTVVGIGNEKGRCYEYLPFMTTSVDEADQIMRDEDYDFLQMDEQYAIDQLNDLEDKVKTGFAKEAVKYDFNLPSMSKVDMANIVSSLSSIKDELKKRVIPIS